MNDETPLLGDPQHSIQNMRQQIQQLQQKIADIELQQQKELTASYSSFKNELRNSSVNNELSNSSVKNVLSISNFTNELSISSLQEYWRKVKGQSDTGRDSRDVQADNSRFLVEYVRPSFYSLVLAFIGPFVVFLLLTGLTKADDQYPIYFNGSFSATVVLLFTMPNSPAAHPTRVVMGLLVSGVAALVWRNLLSKSWITSSLSVASSVFLMRVTGTSHPPGGATAFIISELPVPLPEGDGFFYLVMPLLAGNAIMIVMAVLLNNIPKQTCYPNKWL